MRSVTLREPPWIVLAIIWQVLVWKSVSYLLVEAGMPPHGLQTGLYGALAILVLYTCTHRLSWWKVHRDDRLTWPRHLFHVLWHAGLFVPFRLSMSGLASLGMVVGLVLVGCAVDVVLRREESEP